MIGVDYGLRRVAVACPDEGWAYAYTLKAEMSRAEELDELSMWVKDVVPYDHRPVFVESPIGGASGNMQTLAGMAETCGAILACFPGRAHKVAPSSWKALVCGSGRLDKAGVAAWLEREHPSLAEACRKPSGKLDQDRVDATCLGLCTVDGLAAASSVSRHRPRPVLRKRRATPDQPG